MTNYLMSSLIIKMLSQLLVFLHFADFSVYLFRDNITKTLCLRLLYYNNNFPFPVCYGKNWHPRPKLPVREASKRQPW